MPRPVVAAMLVSGIVATAQSADMPDLANPDVISAGRRIFVEKHCSHCHGANGDGASI
jgi:mono/diheme cytochrome c family protein